MSNRKSEKFSIKSPLGLGGLYTNAHYTGTVRAVLGITRLEDLGEMKKQQSAVLTSTRGA